MALNPTLIQLLRKVFIFSTFTEDQLSLIANRMELISVPAGTTLFNRGDPGKTLYVVVSGSLRIIDENKETGPGRQGETTRAYLDRGDALGETAILTGDPPNHRVQVETTAELLVLKKTDFDELLEKHAPMAVHLSRLLSSHWAGFLEGNQSAPKKAKIFSIIPHFSMPEQVLFSINLSISLVEQTRRKILLIAVGEGYDILARALGLHHSTPPKNENTSSFFQNPAKLDDLIQLHSSGLELLAVEETVFIDSVKAVLPQFLKILKAKYDICLFVMPPKADEPLISIFSESDRSFFIHGISSKGDGDVQIRALEHSRSGTKKVEHVWLSTPNSAIPIQFKPDTRLHWESGWGPQFMRSGSPFLASISPTGKRSMDRFARILGELTIGFAMGSGAAFGYALIGMLKVFEKEGVYPDVIGGTSMGALLGAFYASGMSPDEIEQVAFSITRWQMYKMVDLAIPPRSGLFAGKGLLKFLRSHLGETQFSDLLLPFSCVATDIETGKEIIIDDGNVAEAVRASTSLPFFFRPYYKNGRYLVDGGLVNPVPTSVILNLGANILISANLTQKTGEKKMPLIGWRKHVPFMLRAPSIIEVLRKTITTMQFEIASARSEIAHVVISATAGNTVWWELDKAKTIIELGERAAEESMPKIKSLIPYFKG